MRRLLILMLLLGVPAMPRAAANDPADCAALLHRRCEVCHYKNRYCQKLGQKNKRAWQRSIKTMVAYGTKMTGEEQQLVLDCLAAPTPAVQDYCKAP